MFEWNAAFVVIALAGAAAMLLGTLGALTATIDRYERVEELKREADRIRRVRLGLQ